MRRRLRAVVLAVVGLSAASALAGPGAAARPAGVAKGVTVESVTARLGGTRPERVHLLRLNLGDPHVHLDVGLPKGLIGARRATVQSLAGAAGAAGAVAAVNADFFDPNDVGAQPNGGVVIDGHIVKSPRKDFQANFIITRKGRARIGSARFIGSVTRPAGLLLRPAVQHSVFSKNTVHDARLGRITLVTPDLASVTLKASCTVVGGTNASAGQLAVTSVRTGVTRLARLPAGRAALVACGTGAAARWLSDSLAVGDTATVTTRIDGPQPETLVSGGRVLVRHGKVYADPTGRRAYGLNPVTFGCASADGRSVILGVVDGRWSKSRGLTYGELAKYLVLIHCYDGMVFDGGGSSTLVARRAGHRATSVLNHPSDGRARPIANALVVSRR